MDKSTPEPPKKPLSTYFLYKGQKYDEFKKKNPDMKMTEITSAISEDYRKLTEKEMDKLKAQAAKNKEKYEEEYKAFCEKYGTPEKKKRKEKKNAKEEESEKPKKEKKNSSSTAKNTEAAKKNGKKGK